MPICCYELQKGYTILIITLFENDLFIGAGDTGKSTNLALILGPVFGVVFLVPLLIALYLCCRSKKQKRVVKDGSNMGMKKMSLIVETMEGISSSENVSPVQGIDNKSLQKKD